MIIEDASRFARDPMTQELGILSLIKLGVRGITATGDPTKKGDEADSRCVRRS